jgi:hypothetical protein
VGIINLRSLQPLLLRKRNTSNCNPRQWQWNVHQPSRISHIRRLYSGEMVEAPGL